MSGNKKMVLARLEKEERRLKEEPLEQAWIARQGVLGFHFCLHSLPAPYSEGYYHGVLQLSDDYPFAPPTLTFFTPSGRFEVNKHICTTFTNFHRQTWTSSWTVKTMVLATISFMNEQAPGSVGSVQKGHIERETVAQSSMQHNLKNPLFRKLFQKQLSNPSKYKLKPSHQLSSPSADSEGVQGAPPPNGSWKLYSLYALVFILVIAWASLKGSNEPGL